MLINPNYFTSSLWWWWWWLCSNLLCWI